ncbi:MAG: copper chaperone PCu(A)C [Paracoccaceae bacterium]|nr:copper chaperone PCu(A)C [Paracoccaceae bacterium]
MSFLKPLAAALAVALALPAFAQQGLTIAEAYALSSGASAKSGAAFMVISNPGPDDDRLIAARSDAAERVELHTHLIDANGVARMVEVEDGFAILAGATHALQRGGDHIMFLGLTAPFEQGDTIPVTLVFERAGEIIVEVPVALPGQPMPGAGTGHGMMHGSGG